MTTKKTTTKPLRKGRGVTDAHNLFIRLRRQLGYLNGWTDGASHVFELQLAALVDEVQLDRERRAAGRHSLTARRQFAGERLRNSVRKALREYDRQVEPLRELIADSPVHDAMREQLSLIAAFPDGWLAEEEDKP